MISYIDIAFAVLAVLMTVVNAKKGLVVALVGMVRFFLIVPASYFLVDIVSPYIPQSLIDKVPEQAQGIVVFLIVFVVLIILTGLLIMLLKKLQHKKGVPLRHTNAFLGGLFGLVKALILIFVLSAAASLALEFIPKDNQFYEILGSSYVVDFVKNFELNELKAFQI